MVRKKVSMGGYPIKTKSGRLVGLVLIYLNY